MNVLVINCGSSSVKYQVLNPDKDELLCKGLIELSGDTSTFSYTRTGSEKMSKTVPLADHTAGVKMILETITDPEIGCISGHQGNRRCRSQNGTRRRRFCRIRTRG